MKFADLIEGRNNNLNLMRLIAASAVALSHAYLFTGQLAAEPLYALTGNVTLGYLSVFIFFVISGLLVAQSFERNSSLVNFIVARLLRIYPALAVVLLLSTYLLGPIYTNLNLHEYFSATDTRRYVEDNLLLKVHSGLPGVFLEKDAFSSTINGSIWTLRYEVYAYLLLALAGISGLVSSRAAFNLFVLAAVLVYAKSPYGMLLVPGAWDATIYVPLLGFLVGAGVYVNRAELSCKLPYALICLVLYVLLRRHEWIHVIFAVTLGYVVLTLGYHPDLQLNMPLRNDYSYGVYLYAFPVQQAIMHTLPTQSPALLFFMTMLFTVPLAMLSWHLLEKPALKLKRK